MFKYVVDSRLSRFTVQAFAGGFLSAFAHSPRFAIRTISSEVRLDPRNLGSSELRLEIAADSLELLDDVSEKDRREIGRVMRREVLEAARYPAIVFESARVAATRIAEGRYNLGIEGALALHGVTRALTVPASVAMEGDALRASGSFSLRPTDYRIKLVAVAGGAIKVKDELRFAFDLVARKQG